MEILFSNSALGYALIMGAVLLAVVIYTIIKLRKQVKKAKDREKKKDDRNSSL